MAATTESLLDLLRDYNQRRCTEFTPWQFTQMLYFTPMLMVAASDMNVDGTEMGYLTGLVAEQTLSLSHAPDADRLALLHAYIAELKYLIANLGEWEPRILPVLRDLLATSPSQVERLRVRMLAMAMASRGVNHYEEAKIAALAEQLGFQLHAANT